jgi:hypothetical protein
MDLTAARDARRAGSYDKAMRLYRCVPYHVRSAAYPEFYRCRLELTIAQRVVGDFLNELGWSCDQYEGFTYLEPHALGNADTAGLEATFTELSASGCVKGDDIRYMRASLADEAIRDSGSEDAARATLEHLGCPIQGGVRLALARVCLRARRLSAAVAELRNLVIEAPLQPIGWNGLAITLLAEGEAGAALVHAQMAALLHRNRPDLNTSWLGLAFKYRGYDIFFVRDKFCAVASPRTRIGWLLRGLWRRIVRNPLAPIAARSENLLEVTARVSRLAAKRMR